MREAPIEVTEETTHVDEATGGDKVEGDKVEGDKVVEPSEDTDTAGDED